MTQPSWVPSCTVRSQPLTGGHHRNHHADPNTSAIHLVLIQSYLYSIHRTITLWIVPAKATVACR